MPGMVNLRALVDLAPVAQLDRVADFESEGCRFESCRARFCNSLSQKILRFSWKCFSARKSTFLARVGQFWISQVVFQDFS